MDDERLLASNREVRLAAERLEKDGLDEAERLYDRAFDDHHAHDTLVDICASAFGPTSRLFRETGYAFFSTEPLVEIGVRNFDLLIYNPSSKAAIFVECKGGLSNPARDIDAIYEKITEVERHREYLSVQLGDEIKSLEFVICVPAEYADRAVREIEQREEKPGHGLPPIRVWHVNWFREQTLQLWTRISGREPRRMARHADARLTAMLAEGVRCGDVEVFAGAYPSSHPARLGQAVLAALLPQNVAQNRAVNIVDARDVEAFFVGSMVHYLPAQVGKQAAERFIREGLAHGLLEQVDGAPNSFKVRVDGRSVKTILDRYKRDFREAAARRIARRKAIGQAAEDFRRANPPLEKYGAGNREI